MSIGLRILLVAIVLAAAVAGAFLFTSTDPSDAEVTAADEPTRPAKHATPENIPRADGTSSDPTTGAERREEESEVGALDLSQARPVVGVVRLANGQPAVHAWISAVPDDGKPTKHRELTGDTGAEGRYRIAIPPGRFTLAARHAGTGTARVTVRLL